MRKYLCYVFLVLCTMFMGVTYVKAATSSFVRESSTSYRYSWSGLTDIAYVSYTLTCTGGYSTSSSGGNNNGPVVSESGYVVLNPNGSSGTLSCEIVNGNGAVVTSAKIDVTTTTTSSAAAATTTTTTTTQTTARSSNNYLSSITITTNEGEEVELSPTFSSTVYTYQATVASTVRTVSVDASMQDSRANLTINGSDEELNSGENNVITITVTAEDGTPRTYTINVLREALTADATLSELTIEECEDFELEENKYSYDIEIDRDVDSLTISYVLSDPDSTVEIEGNENLENGSKVRIIVTAPDGTKRVYTLNIIKETTTTTKSNTSSISAEKNPLIIMGLSVVAFGLIGGIIYVIKK